VKIRSQQDFFSGLMFTAAGLAFAWAAAAYPLGSAAAMGPGYFPLMLGLVLAALGLLIMFKALVLETETGNRVGRWAWRPLLFVLGANVLFGLLLGGVPSWGLPGMGLVVAIYGLTLVASLAARDFRLGETLMLATVLALGCYLVFVLLLKLQFPVWPDFIST